MHDIHFTIFRGGNAAPNIRDIPSPYSFISLSTSNHGQTPNFLQTHVILVGVTCGSSIVAWHAAEQGGGGGGVDLTSLRSNIGSAAYPSQLQGRERTSPSTQFKHEGVQSGRTKQK